MGLSAPKWRFSTKKAKAKTTQAAFDKTPVIWTRREKGLVILFSFVILAICLGAVATSAETDRLLVESNRLNQKTKQVQEDNDTLRYQIRSQTNADRLKALAKKEQMDPDPSRTKCIR